MKRAKLSKKKFIWIAQKKRLDALNATQKNQALYKVRFLKKIIKTSKNTRFLINFG